MHKMCSDERKCALMKGCFVVMNRKEIKHWYVRVEIGVKLLKIALFVVND